MTRVIEACFVCSTPFQVLTSMNLVLHYKMKADLYIVPQFSNANILSGKIRKHNIFLRTVLVDTGAIEQYKKHKKKLFVHIGIAKNYINIDKIVPGILVPDTSYKKLYVSSKVNIGRLISLFFIKHRMETEVIYIDDGESSYDNPSLIKPSATDALLRRFLFGRKTSAINKMLLYSPPLYKRLNPNSKASVDSLPYIKKDENTRSLFNEIFGFNSKENIIRNKVILLDIIRNENLMPGEDKKMEEVYALIFRELGSDNIIIKRHPRDKAKKLNKVHYYNNNDAPFEVVLMNMDVNQKILITVNSTAVVMPKMLFNQEPIVIYLGNLIQTRLSKIADTIKFYSTVKELYADPKRFFMPDSIQELNDYLVNLRTEF